MNDFIEFAGKAVLLQNNVTRDFTDFISKLKSSAEIFSVLQNMVYWRNLLQLTNSNLLVFQSNNTRQAQMSICNCEIIKKNADMQNLAEKAVCDALLSQLTQPCFR